MKGRKKKISITIKLQQMPNIGIGNIILIGSLDPDCSCGRVFYER